MPALVSAFIILCVNRILFNMCVQCIIDIVLTTGEFNHAMSWIFCDTHSELKSSLNTKHTVR